MPLSDVLFGDLSATGHAALKAVLMFLTALAVLRFSERRTVGQMTPYDFIVAVAVGAIVGRTATSAQTPWLTGAVALLALALVHTVVSRLRLLPWVHRAIDPQVHVLVRDGEVDHRKLRRAGLLDSDLAALLRQQGVSDVGQVHLAVFESKGGVSVLTSPAEHPDSSTEPATS
ncbi:DUF421 domain-containing protein [Modestobacter italicus]|uniref:DUF421 domain-containing protein n=1 Tax=Modestobacter italicus (strain DSM 44449 / CECT 9708 / BC 501) TaxID=2732864 RepID=UPI001C96E384|nr:YetF domain-containing protein [Modestobacter italicus]